MTIQAILFDYGGVLAEPLDPPSVRENRNQLAISLGFQDGQAMWNLFYISDIWQATKTGKMTDCEMWASLLSPFGLDSQAEQTAFTKQLFAGEGVQPQMRWLLDDLHGRYPLAILSNASDILESVLKEFKLDHYFNVIVNSHRIGVAKPETAAYQIALQQMNRLPQEVLFIDDQERNTKVAQALGITSHIYTDVFTLLDELAREEII
jgi:putative hydrolase of the HAD superfamily